MAIFEDLVPEPKRSKPTPFDLQCAKQLLSILVKHLHIAGPKSATTWSVSFRYLRKVDGFSEHSISSMLNWYEANIKNDYMPLIHSAKTFRAKYNQLEAAKARKEKSADSVAVVEPLAKAITERLLRRHWPKTTKEQLSKVVQLSINNQRVLTTTLRRAQWCLEDSPEPRMRPLLKLVEHVIPKLCSSAFIEQWMLGVNENIVNWTAWNGNLSSMAFDTTSTRFVGIARTITTLYCNDCSRWDRLALYMKDLE